MALWWKGSGLWRNDERRRCRSPSAPAPASASTRLQNGHWKSENSTMVTLGWRAALASARRRPRPCRPRRRRPGPCRPAAGAARRRSGLRARHERRVELARRPRPCASSLSARAISSSITFLNSLVRHGARDRAAVDEEVRRALHADLSAERHVGVDAALVRRRVERGLELAHVEAELPRVLLEVRALDVLLVGEELVVHLPELPLLLRGERRLGRERRVGVEGERVVRGSTSRTCAGYSFSILVDASGSTRLQNGHWKSEKATMVTFAFSGPRTGPSTGTRKRSTSPTAGSAGPPLAGATSADFSLLLLPSLLRNLGQAVRPAADHDQQYDDCAFTSWGTPGMTVGEKKRCAVRRMGSSEMTVPLGLGPQARASDLGEETRSGFSRGPRPEALSFRLRGGLSSGRIPREVSAAGESKLKRDEGKVCRRRHREQRQRLGRDWGCSRHRGRRRARRRRRRACRRSPGRAVPDAGCRAGARSPGRERRGTKRRGRSRRTRRSPPSRRRPASGSRRPLRSRTAVRRRRARPVAGRAPGRRPPTGQHREQDRR